MRVRTTSLVIKRAFRHAEGHAHVGESVDKGTVVGDAGRSRMLGGAFLKGQK
jgi:hypothetical protein